MKRVLFVLMACCLIGIMQAELAITDGDFEDESEGANDIVGWFDSDGSVADPDGAAWWNTASNTQGPEPFPTNSAFLGDNFPALGDPDGGGRWMYQEIGTKEANTGYTISFEYAQPTDGNTNRSVAIQIDIYQGTFGGAADDTDIEGQGLTLIDSVSTPRISNMDLNQFSGELDLTLANTADPLWIRLTNLPGIGTDNGAWVCVDNVEILSQTLKFIYVSPLDEATGVAVETASTENDLTWDVVDPNIVEVDLYFGTEGDPNLMSPMYQVIDGMAVTPGQYTWSPPSDLEFFTDYYWKVVGWEPNVLGGLDAVPGPVWTFRSINDLPSVDPVDPVFQSVAAGEDAVLTVESDLVLTYEWFKVGSETPLSDGADYSGTGTDTLTILDVQLADEGYYYCVGTNNAGSDSSVDEETGEGDGRVMVQRLTSYWPLDTDQADVIDSNSVQLDTVDGYHMVLASYPSQGPPFDAGLDYPTLDPNVVDAVVGDESLWFKNDNAADPNNGFRQYALVKAGVAEFGSITISCWVYDNAGSNWARLLDFGNGTGEYMFLSGSAGGDLRFVVGGAGNENTVNGAGNSAIATGQWVYVTVTLDDATDTARMYYNGELVGTNDAFTFHPYDIDMQVNYVGDSQYGADPYFDGLIDDLKIYNYALSTEQIAQDYLDVRGAYICNNEVEALVYDFDDDCQTTLSDFAMFATEWLESNRIYPD